MTDYAAPASSAHAAPEPAVRHDYPLAIEDAGLSTAIGLMLKTMPYALARFGTLFTVSLVTIVWSVLTFGGWVWLSDHINGVVGLGWFFTGCVFYGYVWRTFVRYFLHLLKIGHIAVLTELITRGQIGNGGESMMAYGKRVVTERFGQTNAMFALDLLVSGVVRAFNRSLNWIAELLPVPGLSSVVSVVNTVVYAATTFVDETIFSYSLARGHEDPFRTSRDGLIYYAQNAKEVLKTGVLIVVLDKIATFFVWLLMWVPALAVGWLLPRSVSGAGSFFTFIVAACFALNLRSAFLKPLFLTMVMIKFHVCAKGQPINLEWDATLTNVSNKFVELKNKIGGPIAAPAPAQLAID